MTTTVVVKQRMARVVVRKPGPRGLAGDKGDPGLTAYEVALANGFEGTEEEWLTSLQNGPPGLSAYQIAVAHGFVGTEEEWLASLEGSGTDVDLSGYATIIDLTDALAAKADASALSTKVDTDDERLTDERVPPDASVTPAKLAFDVATQAEFELWKARTDNPHNVTKAQTGLSLVNNTSDIDKPISAATAAALAFKADLVDVGGVLKIPTGQLPAISFGERFTVASQAAMLALTAQIGDVAIRSDETNQRYLLLGNPATLDDWFKLTISAGGVVTVNGHSGAEIVLGKADVGLDQVDNTSDLNKPISIATQSALDLLDAAVDAEVVLRDGQYIDLLSMRDGDVADRIAADSALHDEVVAESEARADWALLFGGQISTLTDQVTALQTQVDDLTALLATHGKGWINAGSDVNTARPEGFASVEWFIEGDPVNGEDGDTLEPND